MTDKEKAVVADSVEVTEEPKVVKPRPPTVEELVNDAIASLPVLSGARQSLDVVMRLLATYVGGWRGLQVQKLKLEEALAEAELFNGWTSSSIKAACEAVLDGLAEAVIETQQDFERLTGTKVSGMDFRAFSDRFTAERDEQKELARQSREWLEAVMNVAGQLGIQNPDPGARPQVEEKASIGDRLASVAQTAGKRVKSIFVVEKPDAEQLAPGWETPPILIVDKSFQSLGAIQTRLERQKDVEQVWMALENSGKDRQAISELLEHVATTARDQLAQSRAVMERATADNEVFTSRIAAIQDIQGVVLSVVDFFFPKQSS